MRILVTGATGLIGSRLTQTLLQAGHRVVCAGRRPPGIEGAEFVAADFSHPPGDDWWARQLVGMDAVVNAVGIFREGKNQSFDAIHHRGPVELFRACVTAGVGRVVQISALGADAGAQSAYHRSKRQADQALQALDIPAAIVQPSLVFALQGRSTGLFTALAACRLLVLPRRGASLVQPIHLDDVVDGVVALLQRGEPCRSVIAFVGPEPLPLSAYLAQLRSALRLPGRQWVLPLPERIWLGLGTLASHWPGGLLDRDAAAMLLRENHAGAGPLTQLLDRLPRPVSQFIDPAAAPMLRTAAVMALWAPVLRLSLAAVWLWTAAVSYGLYPTPGSYELLARFGLHGAVAALALYGAATMDFLLGVLTVLLPRQARQWLWPAQLLLIAGYMLLITWRLPEQWLHPFGPISKNLPMMAAIGLLWSLEGRARG
jgi:uncharacterized protein YbjT (DUF2867 family)